MGKLAFIFEGNRDVNHTKILFWNIVLKVVYFDVQILCKYLEGKPTHDGCCLYGQRQFVNEKTSTHFHRIIQCVK